MQVVDMHCDTIEKIYRCKKEGQNCSLRTNNFHISLENLIKGNYLLQNFAMFVHLESTDNPFETCLEMIDCYYDELEQNEDIIAPVYTYDDIQINKTANKLSTLLTVEEGAVIKGSLSNLQMLHRLGVRMMTLTWNFPNELAFPNFSSPSDIQTPDALNGLTETGIDVVREMEQLGIIIDVSHLSDKGFWDVMEHTKKPFTASHSNARSLCGVSRNLTDPMIKGIADRGGVIGLNFYGNFLSLPTSLDQPSFGTINDLISHAKHIVDIGGIEVLGLGSDYDGIPDYLELSNASMLPHLADAFKKHGFTSGQIEKIFSKNVLRLYKELL